jgi:hypothetical protein
MENYSDTIGNQIRHLPACSAVPQPIAPPRSTLFRNVGDKITSCSISEKREPPLQSSETLKARIPVTNLE